LPVRQWLRNADRFRDLHGQAGARGDRCESGRRSTVVTRCSVSSAYWSRSMRLVLLIHGNLVREPGVASRPQATSTAFFYCRTWSYRDIHIDFHYPSPPHVSLFLQPQAGLLDSCRELRLPSVVHGTRDRLGRDHTASEAATRG
jgi:hypothetical protein